MCFVTSRLTTQKMKVNWNLKNTSISRYCLYNFLSQFSARCNQKPITAYFQQPSAKIAKNKRDKQVRPCLVFGQGVNRRKVPLNFYVKYINDVRFTMFLPKFVYYKDVSCVDYNKVKTVENEIEKRDHSHILIYLINHFRTILFALESLELWRRGLQDTRNRYSLKWT